MQERTSLEDSLGGIGKVERELDDQIGMIELGEAENDEGVVAAERLGLEDLRAELGLDALEDDLARTLQIQREARTNGGAHPPQRR